MPAREHVRGVVRWASATQAFTASVAGAERLSRWRPEVLSVLTYHRVDDPARCPHLAPGLIGATPTQFEEQVALLASRYRPVSMAEVLEASSGGAPLPPRSVLVTFDDAYRDFDRHAWPVLRRHGVPVTMFVPTAYPDHPDLRFWWDRLHAAIQAAPPEASVVVDGAELPLATAAQRSLAYRSVKEDLKRMGHAAAMARVEDLVGPFEDGVAPVSVLGWDDLRRLAAEGVTLAPHSRTHPLLDRVPPDVLHDEVAGSLADLRHEVGSVAPVFAYPSGAHDEQAVAAVAEAGMELAFTTRRGGNDLRRADRLRLRRVNVGGRTPLPLLRAQLLPAAAVAR